MADAGRVIAGSARGVRLAAPGPGTRPLADRVKQAIFGSLEPVLADSNVLDLCAGSGAAAIEALSRGAARAILVERDAATCRVIRENLRRADVAGRARVVRGMRWPTCDRMRAPTARSASSSSTHPTRTSRSGTLACASSGGRMRRSVAVRS